MSFPPEDCQLALLEDGTEIDDDEVLLEFSGKVLLLLRSGEIWKKSADESNSVVETQSNVSLSTSLTESQTPADSSRTPVKLPLIPPETSTPKTRDTEGKTKSVENMNFNYYGIL